MPCLYTRFLALSVVHPSTFLENVYWLVCVIFCCTIVHHRGGCCSSALLSKQNLWQQTAFAVSGAGSSKKKLRTTTWGRGWATLKSPKLLTACTYVKQVSSTFVAYKHKETEISCYIAFVGVLERLRTLAQGRLEGFCMYMQYGRVGAFPTDRKSVV